MSHTEEENFEDFSKYFFNFDDSDDYDKNDECNKNDKNNNLKQKINRTSKTIYENKEIYSLENELIGFIPEKRFKWYIRKGLCTVINENSIKLNFHPTYKNKKVVIERDKQCPKQNMCIVCGCTNNLKKFRVIPYEIKKLLPEDNKSHMSSDVVVVCEQKASDGDYYNKEFKLKLFKEYDIDIENFKIDPKKLNIFVILNKLSKQNFVCENKYTEKKLIEYFGKMPTCEEMNEFIDSVQNFTYENFKTPEEMLVNKIVKENNVKSFITRWKQNFYDNLNPQHLQWDFWNCDQVF